MGDTNAPFRSSGTCPWSSDAWNIWVRGADTEDVIFFRKREDTSSGPLAFFGFRSSRSFHPRSFKIKLKNYFGVFESFVFSISEIVTFKEHIQNFLLSIL